MRIHFILVLIFENEIFEEFSHITQNDSIEFGHFINDDFPQTEDIVLVNFLAQKVINCIGNQWSY